MTSSCKLATWNSYWEIVLAFLLALSCLYLPSRSHSSTAVNRFFFSLQNHTGCKIHLRCESQRNVWAIITLHICGSFFQTSWEFQQSWAVSNKIVFSPQMTPGRCHRVARSGLSSQLSYSADQKSTKTQYIFKKQKAFYEPKQSTLKTVTLKLDTLVSSWYCWSTGIVNP